MKFPINFVSGEIHSSNTAGISLFGIRVFARNDSHFVQDSDGPQADCLGGSQHFHQRTRAAEPGRPSLRDLRRRRGGEKVCLRGSFPSDGATRDICGEYIGIVALVEMWRLAKLKTQVRTTLLFTLLFAGRLESQGGSRNAEIFFWQSY